MTEEQLKLVITAANGRMGRMLVKVAQEHPRCALFAALGRKGSDSIGRDAGELAGIGNIGLRVSDSAHSAIAGASAVIDFTPPPSGRVYAELAAQAHVAYICGATGLDVEDWRALEKAASHTAVVYGSNMSLGVNLLMDLVRRAAAALSDDFDIEIVEMHHRHKRDAPSGTALSLGKAAAEGRGIEHDSHMVAGRHGIGEAREVGTIGYGVVRGGSIIGEHNVIFAGEQERLELGHRSATREVFASGAVAAALWASDKKAGLYTMREVLGLSAE